MEKPHCLTSGNRFTKISWGAHAVTRPNDAIGRGRKSRIHAICALLTGAVITLWMEWRNKQKLTVVGKGGE